MAWTTKRPEDAPDSDCTVLSSRTALRWLRLNYHEGTYVHTTLHPASLLCRRHFPLVNWLFQKKRPDSGIIEAHTGDCCSVCHKGTRRLQSQMVYVWFQGYLILPDSSSLADSLSWAMLHSNIIPAKLLKVFPVEQAKNGRDRITF